MNECQKLPLLESFFRNHFVPHVFSLIVSTKGNIHLVIEFDTGLDSTLPG